jgi:hypothetical protein
MLEKKKKFIRENDTCIEENIVEILILLLLLLLVLVIERKQRATNMISSIY